MAKPSEPAMKTYVLEKTNGQKSRVTVPAAWKLTFGPIWIPAKGNSHELKYALRFYEGNKENQRAVFSDVKSFRDTSIQIEEQVTKTRAETYYKDTRNGRKAVQAEAKVTEWANPDAPDESEPEDEFLTLEHNQEDKAIF